MSWTLNYDEDELMIQSLEAAFTKEVTFFSLCPPGSNLTWTEVSLLPYLKTEPLGLQWNHILPWRWNYNDLPLVPTWLSGSCLLDDQVALWAFPQETLKPHFLRVEKAWKMSIVSCNPLWHHHLHHWWHGSGWWTQLKYKHSSKRNMVTI